MVRRWLLAPIRVEPPPARAKSMISGTSTSFLNRAMGAGRRRISQAGTRATATEADRDGVEESLDVDPVQK
jgi:hypothetical protein